MGNLEGCIKSKRVNHSVSREHVYRILSTNKNCLTAKQILRELSDNQMKRSSLNTIYRHLALFGECGLTITIHDETGQAYYCLKRDEQAVYQICTECKTVEQVGADSISHCRDLDSFEYVAIHKKCKKCK